MNTTTPRGRVVIIGCGPAGMAATISIAQAGHDVMLLERYPEARPAGNILNLWPPPIKALGLMGVDTTDLGAPCQAQFRRHDGKVRARVRLPQQVIDDFGGGFIGMLRPQLYRRLLDSLPPGALRVNTMVESFTQDEAGVRIHMADGATHDVDVLVGADGIDSLVRRTLWGDAPKREHNLHIFGGFTFTPPPSAEPGLCIVSHNRTVQGSWTSILHEGRAGFQWWMLGAHDGTASFDGDWHTEAARMAEGFADPIPALIAATEPESVQRWVIRDRLPLNQWSKGRATIIGDAAHPTSPYAAYGAGMAIEDGYFLGRRLAGVDLRDHQAVRSALDQFEAPRRGHTAFQSQMAYRLGQMFHHSPAPLRPLRDLFLDRTPFLQKVIGEKTPGEILEQLEAIEAAEAQFAEHRR